MRGAAGRGGIGTGSGTGSGTDPHPDSSCQQRLSYTTLSDLALALLDGTVFEIVQGLLEIQHLTEKNLYSQRLKLHSEHRGQRGAGPAGEGGGAAGGDGDTGRREGGGDTAGDSPVALGGRW